MTDRLPENLILFANTLPYPLYVVGGAVRDSIAGLHSEHTDVDICAPAEVDDFIQRAHMAGFRIDAEYRNTGTVKLSCGGHNFEFTCFRSDKYVRGEHRPEKTYFTTDIYADARRRDFKCNAVYYDIAAQKICDPLGGVKDIEKKIISTVAPAQKVFGEDGLRLMRLARISAQTGFEPTDECLKGAEINAGLIKDVSVERIFAELMQILNADKKYGIKYAQYKGLEILSKTGVLDIFLPELSIGRGMKQNKSFHKYDVLEHSLRCAMYADESIRLVALLHDIGKPYCFINSGNYYEHEIVGERLCTEVLTRLKAPKKLIEETARLTKIHMYDLRGDAKENKVRKFIVENYDVLDKLLLLKQADYSACMDDLSVAPSVKKIERIYGNMKEGGVPFTLKELDIKGDELINLGIPSGETGKTLKALLFDCAISAVPNVKEKLLRYAQKVYLPKF